MNAFLKERLRTINQEYNQEKRAALADQLNQEVEAQELIDTIKEQPSTSILHQVINSAMCCLRRRQDPATTEILIAEAMKEQPHRNCFVNCLGEHLHAAATAVLLDIFHSKDEDLRLSAYYSLFDHAHKAKGENRLLAAKVISEETAQNPRLVEAFLDLVLNLEPDGDLASDLKGLILTLCKHKKRLYKEGAIHALNSCYQLDEEITILLIQLMQDPHMEVKSAALSGLHDITNEESEHISIDLPVILSLLAMLEQAESDSDFNLIALGMLNQVCDALLTRCKSSELKQALNEAIKAEQWFKASRLSQALHEKSD